MPIFYNLQSFINVIKSVITNDLLPDLCYVASNLPEKKVMPLFREKVCSGKPSGPKRLWKELLDSRDVDDHVSQLQCCGLQTLGPTCLDDAP